MKIKQFKYSSDNFGYLIHGDKSALGIDCGAVDNILSYLKSSDLDLTLLTNTHNHPDHTAGNSQLLNKTCASFLSFEDLMSNSVINLDNGTVNAFHTPGHTEDSVIFHTGNSLVTGDTLFNGTIGNCFSGNLKAFYKSISFILTFPPGTVIYAGHDYVDYSIKFAKIIDADNRYFDSYLKKYNPAHVLSTLEDELKINPYLRFNDEKMTEILKAKGLLVNTGYQRWESIMSLG